MATHPTPRETIIESGGFDNLDAVMEVMTSAFDPHFGEAWTRSQCAGIMPMRGVSLALAHSGDDDTVQGFALWRTILEDSELLLLAVHPDAQGLGIGHALLDHFIARSIADKAQRLHLEVRDGNSATFLYEHAGFHVAGRRRDYYSGIEGERHDALTYVLMANSAQ
ncbi:GNAT family N-acetyltransferase [Sphingomicrobium sediminis]|uniref:GNAT family N-acetyltransferase n=1 Tax=Sphingomicrobium sediminis TaxID=2950949 RepID=A0A9X2EF74_9SPHN|nr:GNAT family N-acetyltransferase [Sphingomicrobium sediminis]MCM8556311.1 GNAT family N-acetyltransferase [Sphingomicrobium sediminis]